MTIMNQRKGRFLYCGAVPSSSRTLPSLAGALGHFVLTLHACLELGWVSHMALHHAMGTSWLGFISPDPKHIMYAEVNCLSLSFDDDGLRPHCM